MTDRFELEQAIMEADMSKDLEIAFARHGDGPVMTEDEVSNMLMALWQVSALRQWHLWEVFCKTFKVDTYRTLKENVE